MSEAAAELVAPCSEPARLPMPDRRLHRICTVRPGVQAYGSALAARALLPVFAALLTAVRVRSSAVEFDALGSKLALHIFSLI